MRMILSALLLAAFGTAAAGLEPGAGVAEAGPAAERPAAGTKVKTRSSRFGTILVDGKRRTIYLFDKEEGRRSECYGACARAWPPVLTKGRPIAGAGVRQGLLGTIERRNGRRQVTYGGHPLYLYAHEAPGQILCQNVAEFGGVWLVVSPSGEAVR